MAKRVSRSWSTRGGQSAGGSCCPDAPATRGRDTGSIEEELPPLATSQRGNNACMDTKGCCAGNERRELPFCCTDGCGDGAARCEGRVMRETRADMIRGRMRTGSSCRERKAAPPRSPGLASPPSGSRSREPTVARQMRRETAAQRSTKPVDSAALEAPSSQAQARAAARPTCRPARRTVPQADLKPSTADDAGADVRCRAA
mmetsp:Transcript_83194/g.258354  ORF Transcript_83194/g.258354 Transcript_83194/m.258354 type:complete len:202 (+) Transcript_83194:635-1240(+)